MRTCLICQQCKVEQRPRLGLMGRRIIHKPWRVVAADITGPFIRSKAGFEYILVFQDLFTRWVECIPIRKANGKTIRKELKNRIVLRYGAPEVFLSDNGTEFKNQIIDKYLDEIGVRHSHTPPYHPQANPVERVNRTLKTSIMAFVEGNHNTWDEKLPELVFALNNAPHSATGKSPAMLNYGREPVPPGTKRREQDQVAEETVAQEDADAWLERMKNLSVMLDDAGHRSREEQE